MNIATACLVESVHGRNQLFSLVGASSYRTSLKVKYKFNTKDFFILHNNKVVVAYRNEFHSSIRVSDNLEIYIQCRDNNDYVFLFKLH